MTQQKEILLLPSLCPFPGENLRFSPAGSVALYHVVL